jgi:hypothetical protein
MLAVHELTLPAGMYEIRLIPQGGNVVDLGMTLHPMTESAFESRFDAFETQVYGNPAEEEESLNYRTEESGTFALLVWRENRNTLQDFATYTIDISVTQTGVEDDKPGPPALGRLVNAWPNPFNPQTTIRYELGLAEDFSLKIYDVKGRRIRTLLEEYGEPGVHEAVWLGDDDHGRTVPSGVYYCCLKTGSGHSHAMKLILMR